MTLTAVNPYAHGHHGQFLHALLRGWADRQRRTPSRDRLAVVVAPEVGRLHPEVRADADAHGVAWVETASDLTCPHDALRRELWMQAALTTARRATQPDRVFLSYADHFFLTMALAPGPVPLSGLLFRPPVLAPHAAAGAGARLRVTARRLLLRRMLARSHRLFLLDPTALPLLERLGPPGVSVVVPEVGDDPEMPRRPAFLDRLEPQRHVVLSVGALDRRKGIPLIIDALRQLTVAQQQRLAYILAGRIDPDAHDGLEEAARSLGRDTPVQVILENRYLDPDEVQPLVEAADTVLLPYQNHVGSSGILLRAARAGRPVIACADGLLGQQVREHGLGAAVDAHHAAPIAEALRARLSGQAPGFDAHRVAAFAAANAPGKHAESVIDHLLAP